MEAARRRLATPRDPVSKYCRPLAPILGERRRVYTLHGPLIGPDRTQLHVGYAFMTLPLIKFGRSKWKITRTVRL